MYLFRIRVIKLLGPHRGQRGKTPSGYTGNALHTKYIIAELRTAHSVDGTTIILTAHLQYHSTEGAHADDICGSRMANTVACGVVTYGGISKTHTG